MNKKPSETWLIAQIKRNSYHLACRNLVRQDFEIFIPKMKITVKKEKKFIIKDVFVFPGYIFIKINKQNSNWTKINNTYGVSKLLTFNNSPAEISNDLIIDLKIRYEVNMDRLTGVGLQKGDLIKFQYGPFVEHMAKIESLEETNRIWVLLEFLGGYRKLKLQKPEMSTFIKA